MLESAGFQIEVHNKHFKDDEVDPVWLKFCGEKGWIVLTSDKKIERQWFHEIHSAAVCVFIVSTYLEDPVEAWFERIKKALPEILRIIRKTRPPFVAHITHAGISALNTSFRSKRKQATREGMRRQEPLSKNAAGNEHE